MQAIWLEDRRISYRQDISPPEPPPGEALVKVRMAGICATDLELVRGYYPYSGILGHEFVGEVVQAPAAKHLEGKRVVGEINAGCGECDQCRAGRPTHCLRRSVLGIVNRHGAFAEYLTLPVENLHVVPEKLPDEAAVFTEPLAAALEIQEQVAIHPGDRVLVVGAGRLGQLVAATLALTGCDLSVVTRHSYQDELLSHQGIQAIGESQVAPGAMDVVVEATGSFSGFELARKAVRARGTMVMKSTYAGNLTMNMSGIVVDEIQIVGSRCGPFEPALRLLAGGLVDPVKMVQGSYTLNECHAAFDRAAQPGVLKIIFNVSSE